MIKHIILDCSVRSDSFKGPFSLGAKSFYSAWKSVKSGYALIFSRIYTSEAMGIYKPKPAFYK